MKFTVEELFDIAKDEYCKAGMPVTDEGAGNWAMLSANEDYESIDDVRSELRKYIEIERRLNYA